MKKTLLAIAMLILAFSMIMTVNASFSLDDGIDGTVYGNGVPKAGVTVLVTRLTNLESPPNLAPQLEGYSYDDGGSTKGTVVGTDVTDSNGYFHIAWLYAHGNTYSVVAKTSVGDLTQSVEVYCGSTMQVNFEYNTCYGSGYTIGYWKNHPSAWPVQSITIGSVTYDRTAGISDILKKANAKDATYMLAAQLLAVKLNVAAGITPPPSVTTAITSADAFLVAHPLGSNPTGADRTNALNLKDVLESFNVL